MIALLLFVWVLSASTHQTKLSAIIQKHWDRFQASPLADKLRAKRNDVPPGERIVTHKCEHSAWLKASGIKARQDRVKEMLDSGSLIASSETAKRATGTGPSGPLRIYSDVTALNVNDPWACQTVGQSTVDDSGENYVCTQDDLITDTKIALLTDIIIPAITEAFAAILTLPNVVGNLVLDQNYATAYGVLCRQNAPLPPESFSIGVAGADYYVIWLLRPVNSATIIANAEACNYNILSSQGGSQKLSRPLAGSINFNPSSNAMINFDPNDQFSLEDIIRVGMHELTHALGFSPYNYNNFVDPTGAYYANPVLFQTARGGPISKLATPEVINTARAQYGCPTLDGLELENDDGQPGAHWEARLVGPEYMSPRIDPQLPITNMSLAFFKDTGWYEPDYSFSETLMWGNGEGCGWVSETCDKWSPRYFCTVNKLKGCMPNLSARGECTIERYTAPLATNFQYFTDPDLGGDHWPDYCPLFVPYLTGFCENPDNQAYRQSTNPRWGEYYGLGSSCFNFVDLSTNFQDGACWLKRCQPLNKQLILQFQVGESWYSCPIGGGVVQLAYSGTTISVSCPTSAGWCSGFTARDIPGGSTVAPYTPTGGPTIFGNSGALLHGSLLLLGIFTIVPIL